MPDIDVELKLADDFHCDTIENYKPNEIIELLKKRRGLRVLSYCLDTINQKKKSEDQDMILAMAYVVNYLLKGAPVDKIDDVQIALT